MKKRNPLKQYKPQSKAEVDFPAETSFWLVKMDTILIARIEAYRKSKGYNKKETLRRMANALLNSLDSDLY